MKAQIYYTASLYFCIIGRDNREGLDQSLDVHRFDSLVNAEFEIFVQKTQDCGFYFPIFILVNAADMYKFHSNTATL